MNFFANLNDLMLDNSTVNIVVSKMNGNFIVSVLPQNNNTHADPEANKLRALDFTGMPNSIDENFFETFEAPMKQTTEFFSNTQEFLASKAKAKEKTQAQKAINDKINKDVSKLKELTKTYAKTQIPSKEVDQMQTLINAIVKVDAENATAKKAQNLIKENAIPNLFQS